MVERAKVGNLAVLTGDVHSSWAFDVPRDPFKGYDRASGKGSLGVEFAGTSVTSPSSVGRDGQKQLDDLRSARPHLHYVDGRYRGYYIVDLRLSGCRRTTTPWRRSENGPPGNGSRRGS